MPKLVPEKQRQFAIDVVRRLRENNFEAYWAGGCVRDQLLRRSPYDYDVATSARPEEICRVFHDRHTLAIGAAFGVITVVGPRGAGQIEVTTFREDAAYSDGRHPDHVSFSSAQEDAKRRDFTINGMFFDPLAEQVIDYVGGQDDLRQGVVRAIGDPRLRFAEDKLRMLRAVRFAAIFDFQLDRATQSAIGDMADQVTVVSAERIAGELRIVLVHEARVRALELLQSLGLLRAILPEAVALSEDAWKQTSSLLGKLEGPSFPLALAALLFAVADGQTAHEIGRRWKLARKETDRLRWLLANRRSLADARSQPWSRLQRLLVADGVEDLVSLHAAQAALGWVDSAEVEFLRQQLRRAPEELDPPPLLVGEDLITLGIPHGPAFKRLLKAARDAQLDGDVRDRPAALELVKRMWREQGEQ